MALQEYKCPNCGGAVEFDPTLQKLKCPYCDTEFDPEAVSDFEEQKNNVGDDKIDWDSNGGTQWSVDETTGLRSYVCNSCGGEIIGDATTAATTCPYCGNPVVMTGQFTGNLRPDYIIPFKLDKEQAKAGLRKHFEKKFLLPRVFKSENHIDEIKGIYVPFWIFDADVSANINYNATRVRTWSDANFDYTETSHYAVFRSGNIAFDRVPVDGSTKMADDLMESVEPFNFKDALDFNTAYLAGYVADKYDVDAAHSVPRANARIKNSTEEAFKQTVQGYTTVTTENSAVNLSRSCSHYALYPVWILNTTWRGKKYTFAMNGQTGKFVGDLPVDKSKYWKWFAGIGAAASAVILAAYYAFTMFM